MSSLVSLSVTDFAAALASDAPAPGGGSASAAAGACGAALLAMVCRLTLGKEKYRDAWTELEPLPSRLDTARAHLLELADEDTRAYEAIVAARKLPKDTPDQKAARQKAIAEATILATTVPLQTAFLANEALKVAAAVLEKGNPNAASDAWVAGLLLSSAVEGALANVRINLDGMHDSELLRGFREDAADLGAKARASLEGVREIARGRGLVG
jgi:formiminotetrahydrofolate cyclodeaminase